MAIDSKGLQGIIASLKGMDQRLKNNLERGFEDVTKPVLEASARAKANTVKTKSGKPSRLPLALLSSKPPDKEFKWGASVDGGELRMSAWAKEATGEVFEVEDKDREAILEAFSIFKGNT